jgi:hypothetical protein
MIAMLPIPLPFATLAMIPLICGLWTAANDLATLMDNLDRLNADQGDA